MASTNIWMQSLKWTDHKNSLVEVLSNVRSRDAFCDASISCDGKFYSVHKLVMSACSDYLGGLFQQVTQCSSNTTHPVVILNEIQHQHLEHLLDLIYLGTVDVLQSDVPHLIKVAKCLQFKGLGHLGDRDECPDTNIVVKETEDRELNQCDAINYDFHGDECIDPLTFNNLAAAATLTSPEDLNATPLQSTQHQRAYRGLLRGRKWQPGGRGRPPKNVNYVKGPPQANVSRLSANENSNLRVEESSFNMRGKVQYSNTISIECPICQQKFPSNEIETHASSCNCPYSSTSVLRSSKLVSNKSNELPGNEKPLIKIKQNHEELKAKVPRSIPRKRKRKKLLFTTRRLKQHKCWQKYSANKVNLSKGSKFEEKKSVKMSKKTMKNKSELVVNSIGDTIKPKAKNGRLAVANAVIPKVKRRGRPPKIKKIETNEEVSHGSIFVRKDLHYLTTPRAVIYSNSQDKSNSNIGVVSDSLIPSFEWNEAPGSSGIQRAIKIEKDQTTDWQSNLWSNEQFDDVIIKMEEPTEDSMFRIESVTSMKNYAEENSYINTDEDVITDDYYDLSNNDVANNDEEFKEFGTRIKRCRRCVGCRRKENCGKCLSCLSCNSGKRYIRCHNRQCKKLKRMKEQCNKLKRTNEDREKISKSNSDVHLTEGAVILDELGRLMSEGAVIHDEQGYRCLYCPQISLDKAKWRRHHRIHTGEKPFQCSKCPYRACNKHAIVRHDKNIHMKSLDNTKKTNSAIEDKQPKDVKSISTRKILKTKHSATCSVCDQTFSGNNCKYILQKHERKHKKQQRYSCPSCDFSAHWLWEIKKHKEKKHMNMVTKRPRLQCPQCPYTCPQKTYIKNHMLKCHNVNHLENNSLPKTLNVPAEIKQESDPPLSCTTCGKIFIGPHKVRHLKFHESFHLRKMLTCPHCSYHCYRKPYLVKHIQKQHPNALLKQKISLPQIRLKRLPADIFNAKEQKMNLELSKETSTSNGTKTIQTDEQTFKGLTPMSAKNAWIKSENGKCLLCWRTFKTFSNFTIHWRSHTGEKPHSCPHCPYRSNHSSNLRWHINKYHNT